MNTAAQEVPKEKHHQRDENEKAKGVISNVHSDERSPHWRETRLTLDTATQLA